MKNTANELRQIISAYTKKVEAIPDAEFSAKPLPDKWSKKEVLGHLIDSAQNNLRRFIVSQYEPQSPFIAYQQDFWVATNRYRDMPKNDVVTLWRLLNERICVVLENMPKENYAKECNTGTPHTLEWLAEDYAKHMKHHINQIIAGSFDVVYK